MIPDKKEELAKCLFKASINAKRHRFERLISHPWKTICPVIMHSFRGCREITAQTFWGGNMKVVLPEPVSTHIWRYGFFEADVALYIINHLREGMTFIDVGGHFGFFTLLGSLLVGEEGRVLTFEPTLSSYIQLKKNISMHSQYSNIEAIQYAAYSENKDIKFYDYGLEGSAYNSAYESRAVVSKIDKRKEVTVPGKRIDDLLKEMEIYKVDLVKIDAESSELHVLEGFVRTIDKDRPNIIIEVGDSPAKGVPTSKESISWLRKRDYEVYEVKKGEIVPHICQDRYEYGNLIFKAQHG